MRAWDSATGNAVVLVVSSAGSVPCSPPPVQVISHVTVAVTGYACPGTPAEERV